MNTNFSVSGIAMAVAIATITFLSARGDEKRPQVIQLSSDAKALKSQFNQDRDHPRLLLFVSPTCPACVKGARVIHEEVLSEIDDDQLRVYVVWEPILPRDSFKEARDSARQVTDPRASQYWLPDRKLAMAFMKPLGLKRMPAWDVYLAYPQDILWEAEVPDPVFFSHQLPELPDKTRLEGKAFVRQLRSLLQSPSSKTNRD